MKQRGRFAATVAAAGLLLGSGALVGWLTPVFARAATTYKIGVDNAGPAGHDFEYVDYFPRGDVKVHVGDVIDFNWNTGTLDGAHTATLVPPGVSAPVGQLAAPDSDDPGGQLQFNPAILAPTDPTCGTSAHPCVYDGSRLLSSGFIANTPAGADFFVKLQPKLSNGEPLRVNFVCEIHPGMKGSVTVVSNDSEASKPENVQKLAATQFEQDTRGALEAEAAAEKTSVKENENGKRTITMTAGTATQFVEVVEMLPRKLSIHAGDTVKWVTKTLKDPHTVTFPAGSGSDAAEPIPAVCEGAVDTPPPCSNPADLEVHLNPQPFGSTVISTPQTLGSSGLIGNPLAGLRNQYAFSFPNAGTFEYQCRIHDHMVGVIHAS